VAAGSNNNCKRLLVTKENGVSDLQCMNWAGGLLPSGVGWSNVFVASVGLKKEASN
jgi:hypothetical protein